MTKNEDIQFRPVAAVDVMHVEVEGLHKDDEDGPVRVFVRDYRR